MLWSLGGQAVVPGLISMACLLLDARVVLALWDMKHHLSEALLRCLAGSWGLSLDPATSRRPGLSMKLPCLPARPLHEFSTLCNK